MGKKHAGYTGRANPSCLGFLLLDSSFTLIYANPDAVQLLAYPKSPREIGALNGFVANKIRSALFKNHLSPQSSPPREFLSGRRRYRCRTFSVDSHFSEDASHATVVLFERSPRGPVDVAQAAAKFRLTERERETVEFLLEGLTSKQIAQRMKISVNTVKAFIRLIMVKMGVSTRSGIIAKIVKTAPRFAFPRPRRPSPSSPRSAGFRKTPKV